MHYLPAVGDGSAPDQHKAAKAAQLVRATHFKRMSYIPPHMDLDGELRSRLDLSKMDNEKTKQLMALDCLLLDI